MEQTIHSFGYNKHSQNGEDGILAEAVRRINPALKIAVEFGAHDGSYCSNTKALGWDRHLFDISVSDDSSAVVEKEITPENVNELPPCSVLSIDIDGNDYNVWKAYSSTPDIVVIEINSSIPPDRDEPISDIKHGTAFKPMVELGESKGYFLLCHTGNCIFIRNEHKALFPDADETFNTSFL